jgi:beta-lactamase superfamily II metal-dependent hydrolase
VALAAAVLTVPLCRTRHALRMHLRGGVCILVLFAVLSAVRTVTTADEVRILSVSRGKNDAVIVLTAGDAMLMDISDGSYASLSYAYSEAAKYGATELEALYLTHLHTRHIQSTARLCDTVYVRSLFLPAPDTAEEETVFTALSAIAEKNGIPLYVYAASDTVSWGNSVTVRPSGRGRLSRSTHPVIALSVEAGGTVFSYLGASGSEIPTLTDQTKADVLVLGAHGPICKKEIALSLSAGLRAAVLRGYAESFCGTSLQQALDSVDVHTGTATVRFVLKP